MTFNKIYEVVYIFCCKFKLLVRNMSERFLVISDELLTFCHTDTSLQSNEKQHLYILVFTASPPKCLCTNRSIMCILYYVLYEIGGNM